MENVRNKESRSGNIGNALSATDVDGKSISNGDSVRTNDGNKSSIDGTDKSTRSARNLEHDVASRNLTGNTGVEIADGYYFTPRGTIERIPSGHYIGSDGRLRKRRKQRNSGDSNGNAHRDRPETDNESEQFLGDDVQVAKPLNFRGGKRSRRKTVKEETSKLTMVTMLASGAAAIFTSVALLTKHDHWSLQTDEAKIFAEALNEAISTLPEKYYAQIVGIIEKWIPWINLTFVVGAIIVPRIEASAKRIEATHPKPNNGNDTRNAGAENNPFSNWSSLGFNQ